MRSTMLLLALLVIGTLAAEAQPVRTGARVTKNYYLGGDTTEAYSPGKPFTVNDTLHATKFFWLDSVPAPGDCPTGTSAYVWFGGIGKLYIKYSDCSVRNLDSAGAGSGAMTNQQILDTLNNLTVSPDVVTDKWRFTGGVGFWTVADTFRNNPPTSLNDSALAVRTEQWGNLSRAPFNDATALGYNARAGGISATALGSQAIAIGTSPTAVGAGANANTDNSTAVGAGASTVGARVTAIGASARNSGTNATDNTLVGYNARISNGADSNTIIGANSVQLAGTDGGIAIGVGIDMRGHHTVLIGNLSKTGTGTHFSGVGIGDHVTLGTGSGTSNSIAIGYTSSSTGSGGIAVGSPATSTALAAAAFGHEATATAAEATALGYTADATHTSSTVIGTGASSSGVNQVTTGRSTDTLRVPGYTQHVGAMAIFDTTMAQLTADQNDYSVGNYGAARLSSDASRTITGILGGRRGKNLYLFNVGANNIVLANQNASSTDSCRIITGTGADATVAADQSAHLWWDATTRRWRRLQ